jgi:NAD(P)-dependent dehydrogenase (short-subunit alcohol dehydrogenase family)
MAKDRYNVVNVVRQSKPIDTSDPYDATWLAGKTMIITGGASGFGEGFFRKWAEAGANVIIGDVNKARGTALVEEVRKKTGNMNHHFLYCDVTNWQSQVDFFRTSTQLSPHGGIDAVVANAGIADTPPTFEMPQGLDAETPPPPNLKCFEVDILGVMYTAHLAIFWLPRNPNSGKPSSSTSPTQKSRDRHLLLVGSVASLGPIPGQAQYCVSKHGVLGLFRSLRSTAFMHGIRVNMICPYFIDTPLIPPAGRLLLAGGAMGKPEDVVDAGTRLSADTRIVGRALVIGPRIKVSVDDGWQLVPQMSEGGKEVAVWEAYADDFQEVEVFVARFTRLLNQVEIARGWIGWASDLAKAVVYPFRAWLH